MLKIDSLNIHKVVETSEPTIPFSAMFPDTRPQDLAELREWFWTGDLNLDPAKAHMRIHLHSYIVEVDGKTIVIDTCVGNHKPRAWNGFAHFDTQYLNRFNATGITPEQIDYVMCTHLHVDHVGWNTRLEGGRWVPTFPNARYLFNKTDYDYFTATANDPEDDDHRKAWRDSVLPIVENGLAELIDVDRIVTHGLTNDIWIEPAPGHTPGNCTIHVGSGGLSDVIFTGDTFHHPIQLARPSLSCIGDADPAHAAVTRAAFLNRHADSTSYIFPAHFGKTSGGLLRRHGRAYRLDFIDHSEWAATEPSAT